MLERVAFDTLLHLYVYWTWGYIIQWYQETDVPPFNYLPVLFNQLVGTPLGFMCFYPFVDEERYQIYSWYSWTCSVVFVLVFSSVWFHIWHLLLHTRRLLHLHIRHHDWNHSIPWAAEDSSPFEHLVLNVLPHVLGPFMMGWTLTEIRIWSTILTMYNTLSHGFGSHHSLHHRRPFYNFGLCSWTDKVFGSLR